MANCATPSSHLYHEYLIYSCNTCSGEHYVRLPKHNDFEILSYPSSTRLKYFHRYDNDLWIFENFGDGSFFRTMLHPVRWYYKPESCESIQLGTYFADKLEEYYGPFIKFNENDEDVRLFRGYLTERLPNGIVVTIYSETRYKSCQYYAEKYTDNTQYHKQNSNRSSPSFDNKGDVCEHARGLKHEATETPISSNVEDDSATQCNCKKHLRQPLLNSETSHNGNNDFCETTQRSENLLSLPDSNNDSFLSSSTNVFCSTGHQGNLFTKNVVGGTKNSPTGEKSSCEFWQHNRNDKQMIEDLLKNLNSNSSNEEPDYWEKSEPIVTNREDIRNKGTLGYHISNIVCDQQKDAKRNMEFQLVDQLDTNGFLHTAKLVPTCKNDGNPRIKQTKCSDNILYEPDNPGAIKKLSNSPSLIVSGSGNQNTGCISKLQVENTEKNSKQSLPKNDSQTFDEELLREKRESVEGISGVLDRHPSNLQLFTNAETTHLEQDHVKTSSHEQKATLEGKNTNFNTQSKIPFNNGKGNQWNAAVNNIPNHHYHIANTETVTNLGKGGSLGQSFANNDKHLPKTEHELTQNAKCSNTEERSSSRITEVEYLGLDPQEENDQIGSSVVTCCKVPNDDKDQESLLPLNAERKLEERTIQSDHELSEITDKTRRITPGFEYLTSYSNENDKRSKLKSLLQKAKEFIDGEYSRNLKVYSEIQSSFEQHYKYTFNEWRNTFPFFYAFHRMTVSAVFVLTPQEDDHTFLRWDNILVDLRSCPKKELLVLGSPGFGKTTLCSMLAFNWAYGVSAAKKFGLCIRCTLPDVLDYNEDLSEAIVFFCKIVLGGKISEIDDIRSGLEKYNDEILLLLDGYDHLNDEQKITVLQFLKDKDVFINSTIVVTSYPKQDRKFMRTFDRVVHIKGLSESSLRKSMNSIGISEETIEVFMNIFPKEKLRYLSELPPLFTLLSAKIIRENAHNLHIFNSVYTLLVRIVMDSVNLYDDASEYFDLANCFSFLGKMCFEQLVSGKRNFKKVKIEELFGKKLKVLLDCNIIRNVISSEHNHTEMYKISWKVLKVFFATLYLRELWNQSTDQERFLKEVFCCNSCSGDYIAGGAERHNPCMYFVGLIPEIVLKCGGRHCFRGASFEMYYDVERIEHSHAFDSVNLLVRISDNYLSRYTFESIPEDDDSLVKRFGDIMNMIPTDNFDIEHAFYKNRYEGKDFLKILLRESEHPEIALYEVVRSNTDDTVDRLYIDVSFSKLVHLFSFLSTQLSRHVKQLNLGCLKWNSMPDFVFTLVGALLECNDIRAAVVRCKGSVDVNVMSYKFHCNFEIPAREFGDSVSKVIFTHEGLRSNLFVCIPEVYNRSEFYENSVTIKAFVTDCVKTSSNPRIIVDIL